MKKRFCKKLRIQFLITYPDAACEALTRWLNLHKSVKGKSLSMKKSIYKKWFKFGQERHPIKRDLH